MTFNGVILAGISNGLTNISIAANRKSLEYRIFLNSIWGN
jgi:hypothetical protein